MLTFTEYLTEAKKPTFKSSIAEIKQDFIALKGQEREKEKYASHYQKGDMTTLNYKFEVDCPDAVKKYKYEDFKDYQPEFEKGLKEFLPKVCKDVFKGKNIKIKDRQRDSFIMFHTSHPQLSRSVLDFTCTNDEGYSFSGECTYEFEYNDFKPENSQLSYRLVVYIQSNKLAVQKEYTAFPQVKVGTILVENWGYNMSGVTFYKVIERTEKQVKFVKIGSKLVKGDWQVYGEVMPDADKEDTKIEKGIMSASSFANGSVSITSGHKYITIWNGKPQSVNGD